MTIRTRPATDEYRSGWDAAFKDMATRQMSAIEKSAGCLTRSRLVFYLLAVGVVMWSSFAAVKFESGEYLSTAFCSIIALCCLTGMFTSVVRHRREGR